MNTHALGYPSLQKEEQHFHYIPNLYRRPLRSDRNLPDDMATRITSRPRYHIVSHITSIDDDDCEFTVRSNGRLFYIHISTSYFRNSPAIMAQYLIYLEVLRSGEEEINGVLDSDVYEWVMQPFAPLIAELAPTATSTPASGGGRVTLQDYLFPEWFVCKLEAVDDNLVPRRVDTQHSGHVQPGVWLDDEFLDDLRTWVASFHPSKVEIYFEEPEDALYKAPEKVLVHGGDTPCFFKAFDPGAIKQAKAELQAYKRIAKAELRSNVHICRLCGVVQDEKGFLMGMLLTYIDHRHRTLQIAVAPGILPSLRQKWANQITETLKSLHRAGIVWGDAKAENVLVDTKDNAWITDFGGGYTEGWVNRENTGTIDGDLQGLEAILLFVQTR